MKTAVAEITNRRERTWIMNDEPYAQGMPTAREFATALAQPMNAVCHKCDSWVPIDCQQPDDQGYIDRVFECGHEDRIEEPDLSEVILDEGNWT